jgi:hypothetical protein
MTVPLEIVDRSIFKGTDFESEFKLKNSDGSVNDLTTKTIVAKIQKFPGAGISTSFAVEYLNRPQGSIKLILNKTQTSSLESGRNYFDIFVVSNNKTLPSVVGTILVRETTEN